MHTAAMGAGAGVLAGLGTFAALAGHVGSSWAEWAALVCTGSIMVVASALVDLKRTAHLVQPSNQTQLR